MRKVFIDCGTNLTQGLSDFIEKYNIDESWSVYSFEANPFTYDLIDFDKFSFVKFINKAVWTKDEKKQFSVERWKHSKKDKRISINPNKKIHDLVGGGSNIMGENYVFVHGNQELISYVEVNCFDFSSFIKTNFTKEDEIIIKMDIEGAEYEVLNKMILDGTIDYVKKIYVEFHNQLLKKKYNEKKIKRDIKKFGVKLIEWI